MALNLNSRIAAGSRVPIDLSPVVPERLRGQSLRAIGQATVFCGNRETALSELFEITGDPTDGELHLRGDLPNVHRIGMGMTGGTIRIEGNVGRHLGAQMRSGQIEVSGDAGDWLGAEMHGGRIRVRGSGGDNAGSAYPGSLRGMSGGEILIDGDVGDGLGIAMRRGLIAAGGGAARGAGARMIAGTILIGGACGPGLGAGMRRGTIVLTGGSRHYADALPLTFVRGNRSNPSFVRLLSAHLQDAEFSQAADWINSEFTVHHGDSLSLGKAEILVRA